MIKDFLLVGLGGALGSMARYGIKLLLTAPLLGTYTVNALGSFLIGIAITTLSPRLTPLITIGFLGGFTTFSTFSSETVTLLHQGEFARALLYIAATLLLCLLFTYIGLETGKLLSHHV